MTPTDIGTLLLAACAITGSIGSVLMLAYHVGRLAGKVDARMNAGDTDRSNVWRALGVLTGRFDRHAEQPHQPRR